MAWDSSRWPTQQTDTANANDTTMFGLQGSGLGFHWLPATAAGNHSWATSLATDVLTADADFHIKVAPGNSVWPVSTDGLWYGISFRGDGTLITDSVTMGDIGVQQNGYLLMVKLSSSGEDNVFLTEWNSGVMTTLFSDYYASSDVIFDYASVRIQCTGSSIHIRWWDPATTEPSTWQISVTDSTHNSGTRFALHTFTSPYNPGGGSGVPTGSKVVVGLHGHQGGPYLIGGMGSGRDYPDDVGSTVAWAQKATQGPYSLGGGQYAWDDYPSAPYNDYDWALIEPILDAAAAGYDYVALHGFSAGGAVAAVALQNGWQPPNGQLVGVIFDDPADAAGTLTNPDSVKIELYATYNGLTWNANDNNGFDVLAKYESAFSVTRKQSDLYGGDTAHAPMTRLGSSGPYAPPELLADAFWSVSGGSVDTSEFSMVWDHVEIVNDVGGVTPDFIEDFTGTGGDPPNSTRWPIVAISTDFDNYSYTQDFQSDDWAWSEWPTAGTDILNSDEAITFASTGASFYSTFTPPTNMLAMYHLLTGHSTVGVMSPPTNFIELAEMDIGGACTNLSYRNGRSDFLGNISWNGSTGANWHAESLLLHADGDPISIDVATRHPSSGAGPLSWVHSGASPSARAAIVYVYEFASSTAGDVASVTWNGEAMTSLNDASILVSPYYYRVNTFFIDGISSATSHNVVITDTAGTTTKWGYAVTLTSNSAIKKFVIGDNSGGTGVLPSVNPDRSFLSSDAINELDIWGEFEVGGLGSYNDKMYVGFNPTNDDYNITFDVRMVDFGQAEGYMRFAWRTNATTGAGYAVSFNNATGSITTLEDDGDSLQVSIDADVGYITSADEVIHCRVQAVGTSHKVKWWKDDEEEPGVWNSEFTDASYTTDNCYWYLLGGNATTTVHAAIDNIKVRYENVSQVSYAEISSGWPGSAYALSLYAEPGTHINLVSQDTITPDFDAVIDIYSNFNAFANYAGDIWRINFRGDGDTNTNNGAMANCYSLYYEGYTETWTLTSIVDGVEAELASYTGWVGQSNQYLSVRIRCEGTSIKAKMWITSEAEPSTWRFDVTSSVQEGDRFGLGYRASENGVGQGVDFLNVNIEYLGGTTTTDDGNTLPAALDALGTLVNTRTLTSEYPGIAWFWGVDYNGNELQRYIPDNVTDHGSGKYTLTATADTNAPAGYYSGCISFAYMEQSEAPIRVGDYIQAAVKFPQGKGLWGAVWLTNSVGGDSHEIDIVEHIGDQTTVTHHYTHFNNTPVGYTNPTTWTDGNWHQYGVHITDTGVDYYIDGTFVDFGHPAPPDTDVTWGVMANLAVGGDWPGAPDGTTTFPAVMEVGSIKVWSPTASSGGGGSAGGTKLVIGLHGAGGGNYLPSGFGSGVGYPQDTHYVTVGTNGNVDWGGGAYSWSYNDETSYAEVLAIVEAAAGSYDQIIIHGFSAGAGAAMAMYLHGETLNGRIKGYIFDDPNRYAGSANSPDTSIPIVLYGCWNGTDWEVNSILGYDVMSIHQSQLNTTVVMSPWDYHRPYVNPNPPQLGENYGWWD